MSGFQTVSVVGGVSYITEPRKTKDDRTVVNIGLIVSYDKKTDNGWEAGAGGHYYESVTVYGAMADHAIASFKKGDTVIVIGRRTPKPDYTDSKGVEHKNESQIVAEALGPNVLLSPWSRERKSSSGSTTAPAPKKMEKPAVKAAPAADVLDDDDDWEI